MSEEVAKLRNDIAHAADDGTSVTALQDFIDQVALTGKGIADLNGRLEERAQEFA